MYSMCTNSLKFTFTVHCPINKIILTAFDKTLPIRLSMTALYKTCSETFMSLKKQDGSIKMFK